MDALKKTRARAKAAITRLETFVRNSENDSSIDVNEYIIREPFLVKAFEEYITVQNQIEDEDESQADDRIEVEQKYLSLSAKLKRSIQKLSAVPKIENVDKNEHFSAAQKFIYLKTHLAGEPLTEVREMLVTDDNYKTALDLLKKRYSNKLVIINSHLKALIETPNVTKGDASNLRRFLSHIKQHINSLKSLEVPVDTWDLMLIYLLSHKLDFRTHQSYELEKPSNDLPKLVDLIDFIEKRCTALENVTVPDTKYKPRLTHVANTSHETVLKRCSFCNLENHSLYSCVKFKQSSDSDKRQFIQDHKLCFNCFGSRHTVAKCTSNGCKICGKKHHTLLHRNSKPTDDKSKETTAQTAFATNDNNSEQCRCSESRSHSPAECSAADQTTLFTHGEDSQILLGTANIILLSKSGVKVNVRALLDSASQTTFITLETFKRLNDDGYMKIINIQGISNNSTQTNKMVDVKILSRINNSFKINAHCAVLSKITWPLPHSVVDRQKLEIPADLNLADPLFHQPSKIDMLIGADILFDIIAPGIIRLGKDLPTMQNTQLGWIIAGPAPSKNSFSHISINLFSHQLPLEELIPKFWQIEEITTKRFLSPEDKLCERKFVDSLIRLKNGAFQVDLPLRNDNDYKKLGDSYTSAARRFINLEKRFLRDQNLFSEYKQFIDEYVKLGHASGASTVEEGVQLVSELNKMLNSAQFHLHKWNSNDTSLLTGVTHSKPQGHVNINSEYPFSKVLGIAWTPQSDQFNFSVPSLPVDKVLTKRQVLSCIARMFDPLGLIGPIVVSAKILMQKIWCSKINWDERLPPELQTIWDKYSQNISSLATLSIPRCMFSNIMIEKIEIHGFSDASFSSYGACLYIRVLYENHSVSCNLFCAKSRIAPIKTISLPRLELCGAVLLARLFHKEVALVKQILVMIKKFPILLPPKSHFTRVLIKHQHDILYHAGPQAVLSNIRLRFWPLNGLREVKKIIRECVVCHRFRHENVSQIMGNLPLDRISVARCFQRNRPKWTKPYPNLKENMVVLLKEDNTQPMQWPLARILEVMPGTDRKVRVVKVKTADGTFVRPIILNKIKIILSKFSRQHASGNNVNTDNRTNSPGNKFENLDVAPFTGLLIINVVTVNRVVGFDVSKVMANCCGSSGAYQVHDVGRHTTVRNAATPLGQKLTQHAWCEEEDETPLHVTALHLLVEGTLRNHFRNPKSCRNHLLSSSVSNSLRTLD
ncbi:hypothetical protein NQ317_009215 [Molorchus minor]|uniref:Peptidase aspartic putative domain-containing protein n=1 Tax=Molorchus minor TaxID=1323400 RepID=A0ABQ9IRE9_9CUCU|nr:hypothetical protein NQ317_009215 [Molorchus minor]